MTKVKREWLDTNLIGNPLEEELKTLHHSGTLIDIHPVGVACIWGLRELEAKDARIAELEQTIRETIPYILDLSTLSDGWNITLARELNEALGIFEHVEEGEE